MEPTTKKIFTITDPRQIRIHKRLMEIGSVPAGFFKDACRMMEDEQSIDSKINLVAHCLREVMGSVVELLVPEDFAAEKEKEDKEKVDEKVEEILSRESIDPKSELGKLVIYAVEQKNLKKRDTYERKVEAIFDAYGIDPQSDIAELWLRTSNEKDEIALYHFIHRNNLGFSASREKGFQDLWVSIQIILDAVLNKMEGKYIGFFEILDGLVAIKTVTKNDIKKLKEKVPNSPVAYNYFFEKLDNPDWLTPLTKAGFFKTPLPPIVHPDGGIQYPFWSQGIFLKKMAKMPGKQEEVLAICVTVETKNPRANYDLLEIALDLPVEMAIQITESIKEIDYFLTPEVYGQLIKYFAKSGKVKEAATLARKVLAIQPDSRPTRSYGGHEITHDPVSKIRDFDYGEILKDVFPDFVDAAGVDAIKVLLDLIEEYINLSDLKRKQGSKDDLSYIWRSAIESHTENSHYGVRDILVSAVRDACEQFVTKNPGQMEAVCSELEARKLQIFRRLEIHLLRLFPKGSEKKIADILMDKTEFKENGRLLHEYFLLAEAHADFLSPAQRKELWSWIEEGDMVDPEFYKARGMLLTEAEIEKHKKHWQTLHLLPFKHIDPEWDKFYQALVAEVGEPDHPSLRSWTSGGTWGNKSTLSDDDFKKMKPEELLEFLKKWEPPKTGDPLNSSREGTGQALAQQIKTDPAKWATIIPYFNELDPTFVSSVLNGYREAVKANTPFDWKPVLTLCKRILTKPSDLSHRRLSGFYGDDPNWNWSKSSIVTLLYEGVQIRQGKIPQELRKELWEIIEILAKDPDPTPESETEQLKSDRDPLSAGINTIRGEAMEAAIQYGMWVKHSVPEDKRKGWSFEKQTPELYKVLNEHLDIKNEPSLGIRAIYGENIAKLYWCDKGWVTENANKIFPDDSTQQKYFEAAWDSFLTFSPPFNGFLKMFEPQFQKAVSEVGKRADTNYRVEDPEYQLMQKLVIFYNAKHLELDSGLLNEFYKNAPVELKAGVIDFVGRSVSKADVTDEVLSRLVALAEHRMAVIKASENNERDVQEFKDFSWWISSGKFDDKWSLDMLNEALDLGCDIEGDHLIYERYETLAAQFPLEVIASSEKMFLNDKRGWSVMSWGDKLTNVIEIVIASGNAAALAKAKEFIHRLVAGNYPQFRDLLPEQK